MTEQVGASFVRSLEGLRPDQRRALHAQMVRDVLDAEGRV